MESVVMNVMLVEKVQRASAQARGMDLCGVEVPEKIQNKARSEEVWIYEYDTYGTSPKCMSERIVYIFQKITKKKK